jgi:hypothetical protein
MLPTFDTTMNVANLVLLALTLGLYLLGKKERKRGSSPAAWYGEMKGAGFRASARASPSTSACRSD